jgi:hypothetical protein
MSHIAKMVKAHEERKKAGKDRKAAPPKALPSTVSAAPVKENPLIPLSRDLVARMPGGKEALIALRAVRDWKSSEAIRRAHGDLGSYHDVLVELHEAGTLKLKGENFMSTEKIDADYGLDLHAKWVKAGKPGRFSDFIKAAQEEKDKERQEQLKAAGGTR